MPVVLATPPLESPSTDPSLTDPYDQLPYDDFAWQPSHPDQLAVLAHLRGLTPAPVASARVLEIGCASGTNLLPMATALPGATFVGLDRSGVQIARANAEAEALELDNLSFLQLDLEDADALAAAPELAEPFDYIIAHGLWAWVSEAARDAVLRLCGHLRDHGVAYVSFDVLPGARLRQMSRDLLQFHDQPGQPPAARMAQARAALRLVSEAAPEGSIHGVLWERELERVAESNDSHLFHDRLADHYHPVLLSTFLAEAAGHGLRLLGDANPTQMSTAALPDGLTAALDAADADLATRLQYADFVRRQVFRRVLLTPADGPALAWPPDAERLAGLHAWGDVEVAAVTGDEATGVEQRCFERLSAVYPATAPVDALGETAAERDRARHVLLQAWLVGTIQLRVRPMPIAATLPDQPVGVRYSRHLAEKGCTVLVNGVHALVGLDQLDRVVLRAMDGTRDDLGLLRAAIAAAQSGELTITHKDRTVTDPVELAGLLGEPVRTSLMHLVRAGLVLREG